MYLNIPVMALPLPLYEQQMNAKIIADNSFGQSSQCLCATELQSFIAQMPQYAARIKQDQKALLKGDGRSHIIKKLNGLMMV
jgi:hypothetical protein